MWITRGVRRAGPALLAAVVATGSLAGCNEIAPLDPTLHAAFLTVDPDDDFGVTVEGDLTRVTAAATNTSTNTRLVVWRAGAPVTADQRSCVSWAEEDTTTGHHLQQGVALRIRSEAGRTRAVVVTKNMWSSGFWTYDVHVMDSAADQPFVRLGRVDMIDVVVRSGVLAPAPWRLCAQVVGDTVTVKLWPADVAEPPWGDGVHGGSIALPPGWGAPGVAGWYAGHLGPGQALDLLDPRIVPLSAGPAAPGDLVGSQLAKRHGAPATRD